MKHWTRLDIALLVALVLVGIGVLLFTPATPAWLVGLFKR